MTTAWSTISRIRAEVERRTAEKLFTVLLERGANQHAKKEFRRGCACAYCKTKRLATTDIKFARNWDRTHLRAEYRRMLKELM